MLFKFSLIPIMENIIEPTIDFDFSKLYLASPSSLSGGAYFTRIFLNNKPLYLQTPKCLTRQGFIKSGKKIYTDLMFNSNDTILINWLENLEIKCQELIHQKGDKWFETQLDQNDIETAFTSPIKIFKSGKFYLLRTNIKQNIKIYNEVDEIIALENVTNEMHIISILEIQGIKFTSRNFQLEIELKQSMIVSPDPFLDECFIKKPSLKSQIQKEIYLTKELPKELPKEVEKERNHFSELSSNNEFVASFQKENNLDSSLIKEVPEELYINDPLELTEFEISQPLDNHLDTITLKKPNQVYYKIYKAAREKAKQAKKEAVIAFLEAKNIKKTYMLDDIEDSDSDIEDENIDT
jgi:hypothetical protein